VIVTRGIFSGGRPVRLTLDAAVHGHDARSLKGSFSWESLISQAFRPDFIPSLCLGVAAGM
jgi:hypothetical protein